MLRMRTSRSIKLGGAGGAVMLLAAVGGWGMFAFATQSALETERQLRGEIASLHDYQVEYLSERKKGADAAATLAKLQEELSTSRQEVVQILDDRNRIQAELESVQAQLKEARQSSALQGRMPLIAVTPRPAVQDVKAAQEALNELGYGPIKANGAIGKQTRDAVEKYQRDKGLTVTGELYAETLQLLLRPNGTVAQQ